jgi:hypothetical protein
MAKFAFWGFYEVPHRTGTMRQGFLCRASEPYGHKVLIIRAGRIMAPLW